MLTQQMYNTKDISNDTEIQDFISNLIILKKEQNPHQGCCKINNTFGIEKILGVEHSKCERCENVYLFHWGNNLICIVEENGPICIFDCTKSRDGVTLDFNNMEEGTPYLQSIQIAHRKRKNDLITSAQQTIWLKYGFYFVIIVIPISISMFIYSIIQILQFHDKL